MHAIDPENFKNFEWRDKNKFPQDEYLGMRNNANGEIGLETNMFQTFIFRSYNSSNDYMSTTPYINLHVFSWHKDSCYIGKGPSADD